MRGSMLKFNNRLTQGICCALPRTMYVHHPQVREYDIVPLYLGARNDQRSVCVGDERRAYIFSIMSSLRWSHIYIYIYIYIYVNGRVRFA